MKTRIYTLLIFLLHQSAPAFSQAPETIFPYAVGDVVQDFSLINIDGNTLSLQNYVGSQGVLVVFTCNHCPYAQMYEQRIISLHKRYRDKGIPVLAINSNDPEIVPDDSYENMQIRAKQKRYPFPYLFDEGQHVCVRFGATRTPHTFLLDQHMIIRYIGAIDDNAEVPGSVKNFWVENAIKAILANERPDPDFTRAVGCSIRRKQP
jgi:peroxiredoxin